MEDSKENPQPSTSKLTLEEEKYNESLKTESSNATSQATEGEKINRSYEKGGGTQRAHGDEYHLLLVMLIMLRAFMENLDFEIAIEYGPAGKFDDIYFRFKNKDEEWEHTYFQIKHSIQDTNEIKIHDLIPQKKTGKKKDDCKYPILDFINDFVEIAKKDVKNYNCFLFTNLKWQCETIRDHFGLVEKNLNSIDSFLHNVLKPNLLKFSEDDTAWKKEVKSKITPEELSNFTQSFLIAQDQETLKNMKSNLKLLMTEVANHNITLGNIMFDNMYGQLQKWFNSSVGTFKDKKFVHELIYTFVNNPRFYYRHKLRDPNKHFIGRESQLDSIVNSPVKEDKNIIDVAIVGLSGLGKTQILLKHLYNENKEYTHVLWINAESDSSIFQNFLYIAKKFGIAYDSEKMTQEELISKVYFCFCERHKPVVIFDNAINAEILTKYITKKSPCPIKVFVTSNNIEWPAKTIIKLGIFTENESLDLAKNILVNCCFKDSEMKNLASSLDHYPIALHLACSFITTEVKKNDTYKITNFLNEFNDEPKLFHNFNPSYKDYNPYQKSLHKIWLLNKNLLNDIHENGSLAIKIIQMLSFCEPDNIPLRLLQNLDYEADCISNSIKLLERLSLIDTRDGNIFIHKMLQCIIIEDMKEKSEDMEILAELLSIYTVIKKQNNTIIFEDDVVNHVLKLWNYICINSTTNRSYLDFINKYNTVPQYIINNFLMNYFYEKCISFSKSAIIILKKIFPDDSKCVLNTRLLRSKALHIGGLYKEALEEVNGIKNDICNKPCTSSLTEYFYHFYESDSEKGIFALNVLAEQSTNLAKLGKHEEALNTVNEELSIRIAKFESDDSNTLSTLNNKALVLERMGKYKEASKIYDELLLKRLLNAGPDKFNSADLNNTLTTFCNKASVLCTLGNYKESLEIYDKIIPLHQENFGADHPSTITTLNNKALLLQEMCEFELALQIFEDIIQIRNKKFGEDHPDTLTILSNKAIVLRLMQKFKESIDLCDVVITLKKKRLEETHPSLLNSISVKASVLKEMGELVESLCLLQDILPKSFSVLGIHQSYFVYMGNVADVLHKLGKYQVSLQMYDTALQGIILTMGENYPYALQLTSEKACVLRSMGRFEEALDTLNRIIKIQKQKLGYDHISTINSINNKGLTLQSMGRWSEALIVYDELLNCERVTLGVKSVDTIGIKGNKAFALVQIGKYQEALDIFNEVIEKQIQIYGNEHPKTLTFISSKILAKRGLCRFAECVREFDKLIPIAKQKLIPNHPDLVIMINNQADCLQELGRYEEALILYNEVLEIRKNNLEYNHPNNLLTLNNMAVLLQRLGRHNESLDQYNTILALQIESMGEKNPETLNTMTNRALLLTEIDKNEEALGIFNDILQVQIEVLGNHHLQTMNTRNSKSLALLNLKCYEEGFDELEYLIPIQSDVLGIDHPNTLNSIHNKAYALQQLGENNKSQELFKFVYNKYCEVLGPDHPQSINTLGFISD